MKVLTEKYLLRRCAERLVPQSVRGRPKQPYRAPEGKSFLNGTPPGYVRELLAPDRVRQDGLFHPGAVQKLLEKSLRGQAIGIKDNMAIVGILSTQLVVSQFVNRLGESFGNGTD